MDKSTLKQKRKLGFSMGILLIVAQVVSLLLSLLVEAFDIVNEQNQYILMYIINAISIYGAGYAALKLVLRKVEKIEKPEKKKLKFSELVVLIVLTIGVTEFVSIFTQIILLVFQAITGHEINNNVNEIIQNSNPILNTIFAVIIGPIFEELIIRGTLMKHVRAYGDKTAVIYTAIAFGLFHGNINQIPYTVACGLIFGYAMVKSNDIKYPIILHIILNSIAIILTLLLQYELIIPMVIIELLIIAAILFCMIYLPIKLSSGKVKVPNESKYDKKKLYKNIGYIFTVIVVIILTVIEAII